DVREHPGPRAAADDRRPHHRLLRGPRRERPRRPDPPHGRRRRPDDRPGGPGLRRTPRVQQADRLEAAEGGDGHPRLHPREAGRVHGPDYPGLIEGEAAPSPVPEPNLPGFRTEMGVGEAPSMTSLTTPGPRVWLVPGATVARGAAGPDNGAYPSRASRFRR